MKNELGLKNVRLISLKLNTSALIGPYNSAKAVSAIISRTKKKDATRDFKQKQVLLVDDSSGRVYKFYMVTRVK